MVVNDCKADEALLEPFKECMPLPGTDPCEDEWPNNVLSSRAVAYTCGHLGRTGVGIEHVHDQQEWALCQRLAQEAAALWKGKYIGMSDEGSHQFSPFFAIANVGDVVPSQVSEEKVRAAFGGTIRADCPIIIEPLVEAGDWWRLADGGDEKRLQLWRSTFAWFNQPGLHGSCFVQINGPPWGTKWSSGLSACIFPRLVLALTECGSLVGMYSCVVWT